MQSKEQDMIDMINGARTSRGLSFLRADERLTTAAWIHANDIAQHPGLGHVGSDGSTIGERIARSGYRATHFGEITGWGFSGQIAPMVDWWLASPDHAPRLLDPAMTDIGAGYAPGLGAWGHYWTVDMATGDGGEYAAYAPVTMAGGG